MNEFLRILMIALSAAFLENTVFTKAFGTSTLLFASKDKKSVIPFGLSITYICVTSSALAYMANKLMKGVSDNYLYLPLVYVVIIGFIYIVTLLSMWRFAYNLFVKVKSFIHISTFNCAVLGALFINNIRQGGLLEYVMYGLGTGVGFILATFIVSQNYEKLNSAKVPESFRGFPATMIYIGIISMVIFALVMRIPEF